MSSLTSRSRGRKQVNIDVIKDADVMRVARDASFARDASCRLRVVRVRRCRRFEAGS